MTRLYATDLSPEKRTDTFMGKGFEAMMKKAEDEGCELIIGEYYENKDWEID